jgi:beta-carotene ketolase (CrtW type)
MRVLVAWILPLLLSALQLFVVGTVLPHRRAEACGNRHRAESLALPPWLSLLACYHFGYHWEHHEYPQVPWFGLAGVRRQHLDQLQLSSIRLTR